MVDVAQDLYKDQAGRTSQHEWEWALEVPHKLRNYRGLMATGKRYINFLQGHMSL